MGLTLWTLTFDEVLDVTLSSGCSTLCYADDMVVVASGSDFRGCV